MSEETVSIKVASCMGYGTLVDISVAELEKLGFTRTVVKPWKPVDGDDYYYLDSGGNVAQDSWDGYTINRARLDTGNCYQTEAEATKARDKQLATVRVLRRLRELEGGWAADCSDIPQVKFAPSYDYRDGTLSTFSAYYSVSCPQEWHSTREAWKQVFEELEQDVKLMIGVE